MFYFSIVLSLATLLEHEKGFAVPSNKFIGSSTVCTKCTSMKLSLHSRLDRLQITVYENVDGLYFQSLFFLRREYGWELRWSSYVISIDCTKLTHTVNIRKSPVLTSLKKDLKELENNSTFLFWERSNIDVRLYTILVKLFTTQCRLWCTTNC